MPQDPRVQKVQDLAGQIAALRKSYRKAPAYSKALKIQQLTKKREALIAALRNEFEMVVVNG